MKFLCDHMLIRLGKWLRAAGHDTEIVLTPISDREILAHTLATSRQLITRDRHFLNMKAAIPFLIYLKANDFDACMKELNQKIKINWLYAPFTRCLNCNSLLEKVGSPHLLQQIPLHIRQKKNEFWHCPVCNQFYWDGSHTKRMLHQLQKWQEHHSF